MFIEDSLSTLAVFINVLKTGPDRSVGPSTSHKTDLIQCKKSIMNESDENRLNQMNRSVLSKSSGLLPQIFIFIFFHVKTMSFCLGL